MKCHRLQTTLTQHMHVGLNRTGGMPHSLIIHIKSQSNFSRTTIVSECSDKALQLGYFDMGGYPGALMGQFETIDPAQKWLVKHGAQ